MPALCLLCACFVPAPVFSDARAPFVTSHVLFSAALSLAGSLARSLTHSLLPFTRLFQDPEQGIEDQYHKKHDAQYCWRATRLIMTNRSAWLEDSSKTSAAESAGNTALLDKAAKRLTEELELKADAPPS